MTWIGLRDQHDEGVFRPAGISRPAAANLPGPESAYLGQGTLLVEVQLEPQTTRFNLVRYAARSPWLSSLTLCIDPDGTISLLQGQAERSQLVALPTDLIHPEDSVVISFSWNAPDRTAVLSAWAPERDVFFMTEFRNPLPLSHLDAERLMTHDSLCKLDRSVRFAAMSDQVEPLGPTATICAGALLETPTEDIAIEDIKPGQLLLTASGQIAQVRWIGSQSFPARGRFAPVRVRSPYYRLTDDLVVAPEQRLRLSGSEIEYMFGEEEVCAKAGHLADDRSIVNEPQRMTVTYYQVVLDEHDILSVNGGALESLDPAPILADPAMLKHSLLRNTPSEILPRGPAVAMPVLRGYEALQLVR